MNTFELWRRGRLYRYSGPSSWAELSDAQSVALMRFRAQVQQQPETQFAVLKLLYRFPLRHQRWLFDERFLTRQGVSTDDRTLILGMGQQLLDTLTWIGQDDETARFPARFRRYSFQFGTLRVGISRLINRTWYHGPAPALGNCSFAEFMFADQAFRRRDYALLAAVLYRPSGRGRLQDKRQPFDRHSLDSRRERFASLDPALLDRIAFAFGCSLQRLAKTFRCVFQPAADPDESEPKPAEPAGSWLDVAINMVKLDPTRVVEVENLNLYLALKVLNEQIRQAEQMQEQLDAANKR